MRQGVAACPMTPQAEAEVAVHTKAEVPTNPARFFSPFSNWLPLSWLVVGPPNASKMFEDTRVGQGRRVLDLDIFAASKGPSAR